MTFTDQVRPVPPLDDGVIRVLGLASPALTYPRSPRGEYLRAFREALGLTVNSAHRVLDIGLAAYSGLERGSHVFADRATWARAELELVLAAGPGWGGEGAHEIAACARRCVFIAAATHPASDDWIAAAFCLESAADLQRQTVKRGILCRLAGDMALEAGKTKDAVRLAHLGFNAAGDAIGPRPEWLETGLQMLIAEAVTTAPRAVEAVS